MNPKLQVTMVRVFRYVEKKNQLQKLESQNSKREQEVQKLQCSARIFRKQKVFMCGFFFVQFKNYLKQSHFNYVPCA